MLLLLLLSLVAIGSPLQMALPAPEDTCPSAPEVVVLLQILEEFEKPSEAVNNASEGLVVPECLVLHTNNSSPVSSLVFWKDSESAGSSKDSDSESDDVIHQTSLKIAVYIAQLIVFLMAYSIVTADLEQYDTPEPLHKAREIQMIPLPARQNVRMIRVRTADESNC